MDTQNTFLKLSVMGRHEPWAGFLLKYSLGCLYLFISCPLPGEREEKNKHYNSTFGSNSVETKIFISVIKCVNTVAVFNVISLLYISIRLNGRNQCAWGLWALAAWVALVGQGRGRCLPESGYLLLHLPFPFPSPLSPLVFSIMSVFTHRLSLCLTFKKDARIASLTGCFHDLSN